MDERNVAQPCKVTSVLIYNDRPGGISVFVKICWKPSKM